MGPGSGRDGPPHPRQEEDRRHPRIPYRAPAAPELPDRLVPVLAVIHLIHAAGQTSPDGDDLANPTLIQRGIDLARALVALMRDEREARGLLALMLLNEARRESRTGEAS